MCDDSAVARSLVAYGVLNDEEALEVGAADCELGARQRRALVFNAELKAYCEQSGGAH